MPLLGRSGVVGVALATAPPLRPAPAPPALLLRPRVLAAVVATGRRVGVAALERRVVVLRLLRLALRLLALLLAGRALLAAALLATGVAVTGLAALAAAGVAAALLLAGVAGLGVEPAEVLELAMAFRKGREAVELNGLGGQSAIGLPEIDDPADRQVGVDVRVRAGPTGRRTTGGEHPVAGGGPSTESNTTQQRSRTNTISRR